MLKTVRTELATLPRLPLESELQKAVFLDSVRGRYSITRYLDACYFPRPLHPPPLHNLCPRSLSRPFLHTVVLFLHGE